MRWDRYEKKQKYWVEEDLEAEWNKTRKSSQEEEVAYETGVAAEDVGQVGGPLSFDIAEAHAGGQAALQGSELRTFMNLELLPPDRTSWEHRRRGWQRSFRHWWHRQECANAASGTVTRIPK